MIALAALAVFVAALLLGSDTRASRLRRLRGRTEPVGRPRRWGLLTGPTVLAALVATGGLLGGWPGAAVCFAVALPLLTAVLVWRRHRVRSAAVRNASSWASR